MVGRVESGVGSHFEKPSQVSAKWVTCLGHDASKYPSVQSSYFNTVVVVAAVIDVTAKLFVAMCMSQRSRNHSITTLRKYGPGKCKRRFDRLGSDREQSIVVLSASYQYLPNRLWIGLAPKLNFFGCRVKRRSFATSTNISI